MESGLLPSRPSKDSNGRGGGMKGVAERRFRCSVANDRGPCRFLSGQLSESGTEPPAP